MSVYYFTFAQAHIHPHDNVLMKDHWVEIEAPSYMEARDKMFDIFGKKWAFQYNKKDFNKEYFPGGCYAKYSL